MPENPSNHFEKTMPNWDIIKETKTVKEKVIAGLTDTKEEIVSNLKQPETAQTKSALIKLSQKIGAKKEENTLKEALDKLDGSKNSFSMLEEAYQILASKKLDLPIHKFQKEGISSALNRYQEVEQYEGFQYFNPDQYA